MPCTARRGASSNTANFSGSSMRQMLRRAHVRCSHRLLTFAVGIRLRNIWFARSRWPRTGACGRWPPSCASAPCQRLAVPARQWLETSSGARPQGLARPEVGRSSALLWGCICRRSGTRWSCAATDKKGHVMALDRMQPRLPRKTGRARQPARPRAHRHESKRKALHLIADSYATQKRPVMLKGWARRRCPNRRCDKVLLRAIKLEAWWFLYRPVHAAQSETGCDALRSHHCLWSLLSNDAGGRCSPLCHWATLAPLQ